MGLIKRLLGMELPEDYKAKSEAQDEIIRAHAQRNRETAIALDTAVDFAMKIREERIKAEKEAEHLAAIALDYDAQISDLSAWIQNIQIAFTAAHSTKRMSKADKDAITKALFNLPDPATD